MRLIFPKTIEAHVIIYTMEYSSLKAEELRLVLEHLAAREPAVMEVALKYISVNQGSYHQHSSPDVTNTNNGQA